jgi:hypothetical protein
MRRSDSRETADNEPVAGSLAEIPRGERITFHLSEFTALKDEIAEDIKSVTANFQYAVALSGGIAAWLLSKDHVPPDGQLAKIAIAIVWWLPLLLSSLLGGLTLAINWRFSFKGEYLRKIEDVLRFDDLGWERAWAARPRGVGIAHYMNWGVLLVLDLGLAILSVCLSLK